MHKKYIYLIIVILIISSFIAFGRILGNDFVNLDDHLYITENNYIKSGFNAESIKWAFTSSHASNWHPLTWLTHMLDWQLFGANASGHHLVNLLLHIGSAILLFLFLNKATGLLWPAAFVAALFALHPLRVESVAWASERKDVLSLFLGLTVLYTYAFYIEKPKLYKYYICLILFALSLLAKPMLVTLPFVLMLLDYWPLARWQQASALANARVPVNVSVSGKKKKKQRKSESTADKMITAAVSTAKNSNLMRGRLLWEKIPFLFLAVVSSIVTIWAQDKGGAISSLQKVQLTERLANALISYIAYLGKIIWPVDLAVFYPYEYSAPGLQIIVCLFLLTVISIAVIYFIKKTPFLFVGWFWYLGTLVPVIGLVQVGEQAMADRYTYLPSIGISIMLAWGIPLLIKREEIRKIILFPAGVVFIAILSFLTWQQCGYWKNSATLFSHALQVTKNNYLAHNNFGITLATEGKIEQAINHYNEAIRISPNCFQVYNNRGVVYLKIGNTQQAIKDYSKAIELDPQLAIAYNNRGHAYNKLGNDQQAIKDYNKAIELNPQHADAYYNRGVVYGKLGNYQRAVKDFDKAIELNPQNAGAYYNRGIAYAKIGNTQQAIKDIKIAARLGQKPAQDFLRSNGIDW